MKQIRIQKKQGSIVEVLRDEILSGNIPAGTEMTQTELAESLGVSRMPVREALILLEYQGLVRRLPNNHVRVAELSGDCLDHILNWDWHWRRKCWKNGQIRKSCRMKSSNFTAIFMRSVRLIFSEKCWKLLRKFIFVLESVQEIISWKKIRRAA